MYHPFPDRMLSLCCSAVVCSWQRPGHGSQQHACRSALGACPFALGPRETAGIQGSVPQKRNLHVGGFVLSLQPCVTLFRSTTVAAVAFMKPNRRKSRRSRSWHSVGTVARDGCRVSSPTASTTSSSGFLIIKEKVLQAKATDFRLLKGVCTDESYVMVFDNQTFSSHLFCFIKNIDGQISN